MNIRSGSRALSSLMKALLSCALLALYTGCAAIDSFAPRAATFNEATATSKSHSILLNILRAAFSEPLQFTDIATAQGTATAEGTLTASFPIPFRGGFGSPLAQQFISPQPTVRANGSNQFNLANLNTQEFYNGIQTPLTSQQVGTLLLNGFDADVLLMLTIAEVEVTTGAGRAVFRNEPRSPLDIGIFYTAIRSLIAAGISAESSGDGAAVGPPLSATEAKQILPDLIRTTATEPLTLRKEKSGGYQLAKKGGSTRFCFDAVKSSNSQTLNGREIYIDLRTSSSRRVALTIPPQPISTIVLQGADFCGLGSDTNAQAIGRSLKFRFRSVEGIFQYLGSIARGQLGMTGARSEDFRLTERYDLFRIHRGINGSVFSISHHGEDYSIVADPNGEYDGSTRSVQLLTSLLALQSSAKNFPSQNLVTIVGR